MNDHGYVSFLVVMVEPSILCGNELSYIILGSTMITTNGTYPWSFNTTQNTWFNYDYYKRNISMIIHYHTKYLVQSYVALVVVIVEPSILCGNEWSWICFLCRSHGWTKYSMWQMKHIHDHSLPHRMLGSNMTTTNKTYPWSFITTQNTWFIYNYDKRNISLIIMFGPSIMCGNEWSWICFICRSHRWIKYYVW
jgi:hypothetical protein